MLRELLRQQEAKRDKMLKHKKDVEEAYKKGLIPEVPTNFMSVEIPFKKMRLGGDVMPSNDIKLQPTLPYRKFKLMPIKDEIPLMANGGKIIKYGRPSKFELHNDTIPAILQVGEIVIPRNIATDKEFITKLEQFGYNKKKGIFT